MTHHYLLTRFNLALWQEDKNGQTIDRGEWIRKRLELFETYCLPSVAGQTCQEFRWILLVDADTPVDLRERIKAYRNVCAQMKFVAVRAEYYGLQIFTQLRHFSTRIHYPNNHFLTLAECLSAAESSLSAVRTYYGFGSHFLMERRGLARWRTSTIVSSRYG